MLGCLVKAVRGADGISTDDWPIATPEEVGLDSAPLVEMFDFIRQRQIPVHSVQLVRRGRLVLDAYFYPYDGRSRHDVASVTKSITSTLVGLAIERGHFHDLQQPVLGFFPGRTVAGLDARKRRQTLEHLLTMQSGWDCGAPLGTPTINADRQLAAMRRRDDWAQFALDLPMTSEPGTRFLYCNPNCHLLSTVLTRVTGGRCDGRVIHGLAPLVQVGEPLLVIQHQSGQ
jgi:CubicO group peptidase (beta-lactamase class C family)